SLQKSLGKDTSGEAGYLGARGLHLQRAHLINNALPGPGPLGPRRPFKTLTFVPNTTLPPSSTDASVQSMPVPGATISALDNSARRSYGGALLNLRRRHSLGLSLLAN